ncbi:hypothetical protein Lepto7375DRAFT_5086 [Leptolyngbya sp. PCC 7375]|nr:hypothetical protein Lepto7375DRAFT_5086 [Leptolyngbya sp. PCC 7375]
MSSLYANDVPYQTLGQINLSSVYTIIKFPWFVSAITVA